MRAREIVVNKEPHESIAAGNNGGMCVEGELAGGPPPQGGPHWKVLRGLSLEQGWGTSGPRVV